MNYKKNIIAVQNKLKLALEKAYLAETKHPLDADLHDIATDVKEIWFMLESLEYEVRRPL